MKKGEETTRDDLGGWVVKLFQLSSENINRNRDDGVEAPGVNEEAIADDNGEFYNVTLSCSN